MELRQVANVAVNAPPSKPPTQTEADEVRRNTPEEPLESGGPIRRGSAALSVLAFLGVILLLRYAQEVFVPVAIGILVAYALEPAVNALVRFRIPRVLAVAIVIAGVAGASGFGIYSLRYQALAVIQRFPEAAQKIQQQIRTLRQTPASPTGAIRQIEQAAKELQKTAEEAAGAPSVPPTGVTKVQIDEPVFRANDYLWSGSLGILGLLSQAVMVGFLVFFILASGDLFKRKLVHVIGTTLSEKRVTLEALNEINSKIERFLMTQIFTSALVGLCTTAALWGFGVEQPVVWGVAAGIFNSIPYFGAILVTAGLAVVAFLQFGSLATTLQVSGTAFAITSLEGYLLTPWLMGRAARINGVAMFLGLLFWSWLWGVIGLIVAVPLMMVIKTVSDRIESLKPIGELLGDREADEHQAA